MVQPMAQRDIKKMNGQELYEWLSVIPEADRRAAECTLEGSGDHVPLVTAKIQGVFERCVTQRGQSALKKAKRIYLIYK